MQRNTGWIIVLAAVVAVQAIIISKKSSPTGPTKVAAAPSKPFKLEPVPGSKLKRVVLVPRAAERLGIQTATVREQEISPKRRVPAVIVSSRAGSPALPVGSGSTGAAPPALGEMLVFAPLTSELEGLANDRVVHVTPLGNKTAKPIPAKSTNAPSAAATPEGAKGRYFVLEVADHGLVPGQRVSVELPASGGAAKRLVVPYSAVIYDEQGKAWVFTSPAPLTYVRAQIETDYIEGDLAILSNGPPAGTAIVTVGGMLLLGAEILNK
jgi:hypothetical protein